MPVSAEALPCADHVPMYVVRLRCGDPVFQSDDKETAEEFAKGWNGRKRAARVWVHVDPEPDDPSPEEIAETAAVIRKGWSEREHRKRSGVIGRKIRCYNAAGNVTSNIVYHYPLTTPVVRLAVSQ